MSRKGTKWCERSRLEGGFFVSRMIKITIRYIILSYLRYLLMLLR